jgi:AcrR family transcriptional regulator
LTLLSHGSDRVVNSVVLTVPLAVLNDILVSQLGDEGGKERRVGRVGTRGVPRPIREERILEVAGHVFAAHGYRDASMDEIAEQSGFSKPLLYAYFESKEGLYGAYFERVGHELRDDMRSAAAAEAAGDERLRAAIDAFFAFVERRRCGWEVLFSEAATRGGPLAEEVTTLREQIVGEVRLFLERSPAGDQSSAPSQLDALAHAVVGAGESLANWWLRNPGVERGIVAGWLFGFARAGLPEAAEVRPADS